MHSGYDYILQELGLQVTAVIEPRHGVEPTARQLADTIDRIKAADVNVLFAEKYFASKLSDTIREATGVKMYSISHISSGEYTPEKFIDEMRENLATLADSDQRQPRSGGVAMHGPAIEFERVNLTLGTTSILEDVSFKVRAGDDPLHRRRQRRRQDLARALAARADAAHGPHQHPVARKPRHRLRAADARLRQEPADHRVPTSWR